MRSRTRRTVRRDTAAPVWALLGGLLGLTLIAFWFGNHTGRLPSPARPPLMVVIRQPGDDVTFEAHETIGTLWSKPGAPRAIWTLLVTTRRDQTGETALWQIETATRWQDPITMAGCRRDSFNGCQGVDCCRPSSPTKPTSCQSLGRLAPAELGSIFEPHDRTRSHMHTSTAGGMGRAGFGRGDCS